MLLRTPKHQKVKATDAGEAVEELRRDLAKAESERADAVRVRHDLEERRSEVVDGGDVNTLEEHDRAIENAKRRIDVAESAHARLTLAVQAAEWATEQARRQAIYDAGTSAMAQARTMIATEYLPAARALAEIVRAAVDLRDKAAKANDELPEGVEPISLMAEPAFNGRHYAGSPDLTEERVYFVNKATGERAGRFDAPEMHANQGRWERRTEVVPRDAPAVPAEPHKSVVDYLNLPGLTPDGYIYAAPFWGRPRT
ncbi:hypothetical protein [Methylobacterium sp. J-090]|uniref:hypothetical protein n=1 Tax=Methylobacterium sp. J-090 TaxID=2836666 RepID=UPI001FB8E411|nr:hypothetical protein [Methylobacterium sp. J-090]MCJ2082763.1 hypothetical protein [Methylobacterium sp. J-090]